MEEGFCPYCGAKQQALSGPGLRYMITETSVKLMNALFGGMLDNTKCESCNRFLDVQPTVIALLSEPLQAKYVPGTRLRTVPNPDQFLIDISKEYEELGASCEILPSLEALRSAITEKLKSRLIPFPTLAQANLNGTLESYISHHWQQLTSAFFAAVRIALTGKVPGLSIGVVRQNSEVDTDPVQVVTSFLAKVQAMSWQALALSWIYDGDHGPTLEEDLESFIAPEAILPGSIDILFETFDTLQTSQTELYTLLPARFCMEAIRASICRAANCLNPRAGDWAALFVEHEIISLLLDAATAPSWFKAMTISLQRAQATIGYREAWDALGYRLEMAINEKSYEEANHYQELLQKVAQKVGHASIIRDIFDQGLRDRDDWDLGQQLIDSMQALAPEKGIENTVRVAQKFAASFVRQGRIDDLEKIADAMIELRGNSFEARAEIDAWFGSCCKMLRLPQRFLERVGDTPHAWEQQLEPAIYLRLWAERSNALRILGRVDDALRLSKEIVERSINALNEHDQQVATINYAILLRETGSVDAALDLLKSLTAKAKLDERISPLESLVATYAMLRNFREVIHYCDEALNITTGPWVTKASFFRLMKAEALTGLKCYNETVQELEKVQPELLNDPGLILMAASAWVALVRFAHELVTDEQLEYVVKELEDQVGAAKGRGDVPVLIDALRLIADLYEQTPQAEKYWQLAYEACVQYTRTPDPSILLALAHFAYKRGEAETARAYLFKYPFSFATTMGGVEDISLVAQSSNYLRSQLDELSVTVLSNPAARATFEDVRLVGELSRDVVGRAQALRREILAHDKHELQPLDFSEQTLTKLAPLIGSLGVIEWIDAGDRIRCLLTCITAKGEITSYWLLTSEVDYAVVAEKLGQRLMNWTIGRPGDPFDVQGWKTLEAWLIEQLSPYLAKGDHVIFIEPKDFAGLPWHVAAAPLWSSSYAASWSSLIALHNRPASSLHTSLGVLCVPRFGESAELLGVLRQSVQRQQTFSEEQGLHLLLAEGTTCDQSAFRKIMEQVDVATLLCHGFIDGEDGEVALMLAHDGSLPLLDSVASASEAGQAHRMSWRECQHLTSAPRVVFSAACSSGISRIRGLGERLGLFGALRNRGTSSLIAPQWDIIGSAVLPILDDAFERYVSTGSSLGQALHTSCSTAQASQPRWLAWSLALEGDWR